MTIETLLREGMAAIAKQPPGNWGNASANIPLTVPLIAEDYPAKTASMWNSMYSRLLVPDRNMMLVAEPKDLKRIIDVFRADPRYRGGGAGVGFKEAVIPYLDEVTPLAKAMGAVNILKKDARGRLVGDNTDGEGYARSLETVLAAGKVPLKGAHVLLLGAGGSGRAIAFALANKGVRLTILNRTESKARELAGAVNRYFGSTVADGGSRILLPSVFGGADAVISVIDDAVSPLDAYSTIGDMELPVTPESITRNRGTAEQLLGTAKRSLVVSDIRIRKEETPMLAQAESLGFQTLDGIPMVVHQGVAAFWWLYGDELASRGVQQTDVAETMGAAAGL
ncbi:MAG: hypothetical protein B7W98_00910 [Parcubacteria group bacterium 20-58-5]|nr:MAG: hypothetical protein B7W98_00910 [Parcubacteria group bacterium 20-58-5]OYV63732.1 MAG: hypothetical protein B7X03_00630 [Parcubacteria group bacterium 21-58-10]HQT83012.1 hypothetical protein [Candidatus Paceibacterota bacterium]